MKIHKTAKALINRSLPCDLSLCLVNKGYTINRLKQMSREQLLKLDIPDEYIDNILDGTRPPISSKIVSELLYESRFCCCVCRDSSRPVIIHHIVPWEECRSHEKENLVVLCLEHHDAAHTDHKLSTNLTREKIVSIKNAWLSHVRENDKIKMDSIIKSDYACWDYFNIFRLFELADQFKIDYKKQKLYHDLLSLRLINNEGYIVFENWPINLTDSLYWLDFHYGMFVNSYLAGIVIQLIGKMHFVILNYMWTRKQIVENIKQGDIIIFQTGFYFRQLNKCTRGTDQHAIGYKKADGIRIEFEFKPFYATSSSARVMHLTGHSVETLLAITRSIYKQDNVVHIKCSALAMGSYFNEIDDGRFMMVDYISDEDTDDLESDIEEDDVILSEEDIERLF